MSSGIAFLGPDSKDTGLPGIGIISMQNETTQKEASTFLRLLGGVEKMAWVLCSLSLGVWHSRRSKSRVVGGLSGWIQKVRSGWQLERLVGSLSISLWYLK